ncbi:MAG: hypothetical protein AB7G80_01480 [Dongiaceae bacterium]
MAKMKNIDKKLGSEIEEMNLKPVGDGSALLCPIRKSQKSRMPGSSGIAYQGQIPRDTFCTIRPRHTGDLDAHAAKMALIKKQYGPKLKD